MTSRQSETSVLAHIESNFAIPFAAGQRLMKGGLPGIIVNTFAAFCVLA